MRQYPFNIGLETEELSDIDVHRVFSALPNNTGESCPVLFDVHDTLLLHKADGRVVSETRERSAVHLLAILGSLRSQKIQTSLELCLLVSVFPLVLVWDLSLCLNYLGLTVSWEKAMKFFDSRKSKKERRFLSKRPLICQSFCCLITSTCTEESTNICGCLSTLGPQCGTSHAKLY